MKENKLLQIVLIIIVGVVWIGVFFRIFSNMNVTNREQLETAANINVDYFLINKKIEKLKINFQTEKIIDPFRAFPRQQKIVFQPVKKEKKEESISSPAYMLQGIVWEEKNPRAVIVKSRMYRNSGRMKVGQTMIVEIGQSIDYGKVLDIAEKSIIISTYDKKFKLLRNLWQIVE